MTKHLLSFFSATVFLSTCTFVTFAQTYNMANGTISTCGGIFYDNGGLAGAYSSNCNLVETFTSSAGNCLTITFTSFLTQTGNDVLTIYDGSSTSAPVIGNYSGIISPGTIVSSTSSLTFEFVSDLPGNKTGWAATISCASCGTNYFLNNNSATNTCDGLFYDSGGTSGTYGNNEDLTQTYCSGLGNCIQFNFYEFNLLTGDTLKIYDGPSTSSPLIKAYTGSALPSALLSSSGCLTFHMQSNGSGTGTGWAASISCTTCPSTPGSSADYTQPYIGLGGSYVGGPMVATCGGTYTDNGGMNGNYTTSFVTTIYKTFCPASINTCLRTQFYSVDLKSGDKLQILNGPTMGCAAFPTPSTLTNTNCTSYPECLSLGYGPYLSNDQSGCITFLFSSNGSPSGAGWVATFDCVSCPSGPNGTDNSDCSNITPLCSDAGFSDASTGPGVISDVDDACLVTETYTNWYSITINSSGMLAMTIDPLSTGNSVPDDYDWALYGPNISCSNPGNPIRCSTATVQGQTNNTGSMGNTGISTANNLIWPGYSCFSNNDVSETACGNGWVNDLPVLSGQTYYLCISKWSAGGQGFNLDWNLTGGATFDCTVLPIELTSFECEATGNMITLTWESASELNNKYYVVEKSTDGENYEPITTVPGKVFSSLPSNYLFVDNHPNAGTNYYILRQVDLDGQEHLLKATACEFTDPNVQVELFVFDLSGKLLSNSSILSSSFESIMHSLPLIPGVYITAMIYNNGTATVSKYLKGE